MPDDLVIQPERPDAPDVAALLDALDAYLASLYPPEANHLLDVQALLQPGIRFLGARRGGTLVGCGATRTMPGEPDTDGQPYGEIKRMFVVPAARGGRIAECLLQQLEADLVADGVQLALLETGRDQLAAVRLYERCGYRRRNPFAGYPDNGLSAFYGKVLP